MTEMIVRIHRTQRNNLGSTGARLALSLIVSCVVFMVGTKNGQGQFASLPQANSPEEFDAYLKVVSKVKPNEVISAATEFEKNWPRSQLRGPVCLMELEAYRSLNNSADAIGAGERALQYMPGNLDIMADLASIIADVTAEPQQLARAEGYARKTLETLKTFTVPKSMPPQQWEKTESHLKSEAHAAMGLVAYKRGDTAQAIREFETATRVAPAPVPSQYYRLGVLYRASGKKLEAIQMFRTAEKLGEPIIRQLARQELRALGQ